MNKAVKKKSNLPEPISIIKKSIAVEEQHDYFSAETIAFLKINHALSCCRVKSLVSINDDLTINMNQEDPACECWFLVFGITIYGGLIQLLTKTGTTYYPIAKVDDKLKVSLSDTRGAFKFSDLTEIDSMLFKSAIESFLAKAAGVTLETPQIRIEEARLKNG